MINNKQNTKVTSEYFIKSIYDNLDDTAICCIDSRFKYLIFNNNHLNMIQSLWGSTAEKGKSIMDVIGEKNKEEFERIFHRVFMGEHVNLFQNFNMQGMNGNGYESKYIPVYSDSGLIEGIAIISKKITGKKFVSETQIDGSNNNNVFADNLLISKGSNSQNYSLLNHALQSAAHGIVITDIKGKIVWANKAIKRLTGYDLNEIIGQTPKIFKTYVHDEKYYRKLWNTILSGKIWSGEIVNKRKDDSFYFEELTITPVHDENNEITHFIAFKQDITEKRQNEKQLEKSEASLRLIVEHIPAVLWMVDTQLLFVSMVGTSLKALDLKPNQVVGMTLNEYFKTYDNEFDPIKAHLKALEGESVHFELKWKGSVFETQVEPLRNSEKEIIGCVGIAHDITERTEYEKALIDAREKAEESSRLKTEFLGQMSHEIRTPLNVIMSSANLLEEDLTDSSNEEMVLTFDLINSAGKRIIRTIDLLLNMAEIHTGAYDFILEDIDLLQDVINGVKTNLTEKAEEKNLEFIVETNTDNTSVKGDKYSITEIFDQLVDNAIKYTAEGYVKIIIGRDDSGLLTVCICDTGIGISEEYLPQLFEKFSQEDHGYTRSFEGNGLGLALVKEYCNLNNAEIEVESKKREGSHFKIRFLNSNSRD